MLDSLCDRIVRPPLQCLRMVYGKIVDSINHYIDWQLQPKIQPIIEKNVVPDAVIRAGIRAMLRDLLKSFEARGSEGRIADKMKFIAELKQLPIAVETGAANEQHYMIPTEFYKEVLGPFMKYSCGYWPKPDTTFEESETLMLDLYCERAQLQDGMKIMDLGCGWGSVTLFVAAKYPKARITSVSNSSSQREYIQKQCQERGLTNVEVITCDINTFESKEAGTYDRVISIEMFEHMKNYQKLMKKVSTFLKPGGKLFLHIFTHRDVAYHFDQGWMAENFFTGGQMPSDDLLLYFQEDLRIEDRWIVNGHHYSKTNQAWLDNLDRSQTKVRAMLRQIYGVEGETKAYVNWRLFFLTLVECFAMDDGSQWQVSLYRFVKP